MDRGDILISLAAAAFFVLLLARRDESRRAPAAPPAATARPVVWPVSLDSRLGEVEFDGGGESGCGLVAQDCDLSAQKRLGLTAADLEAAGAKFPLM